MGAGIAQISVQSGFETVGREVSSELAERGRDTITRYLTRGVEKRRLSQHELEAALGRLSLATEHPQRVVGMHFFNPAPVLPLVEIVRGEQSAEDAVEAAYRWAERAGKQP